MCFEFSTREKIMYSVMREPVSMYKKIIVKRKVTKIVGLLIRISLLSGKYLTEILLRAKIFD